MVTGLATEDGFVTDVLKERYQREAKGGVGSLIIEAAVVLPSKSPYNVRINDDRFIPGLAELVKAVREESQEVKIGIQIMHFLKISRTGWRQKVEDFPTEELPVIVSQHVEATQRAIAAGSILSKFTWRMLSPWPRFYHGSTRGLTSTVAGLETE